MTFTEFKQSFDEEVVRRWRGHTFSEKDPQDWYKKFAHCTREEFKEAVEAYRLAVDPTKPRMIEIYGHLPKREHQVFEDARKHQVITLKCTDHKKAFKIGQVKRYYLPLNMCLSPDISRNQAFGRAREHIAQYGGTWSPIFKGEL